MRIEGANGMAKDGGEGISRCTECGVNKGKWKERENEGGRWVWKGGVWGGFCVEGNKGWGGRGGEGERESG